MNAILLAAGLGTRFRQVIPGIPKCMAPLAGIPLLEIWLNKLAHLNIECVVVNTHYLSDQVEAYIASNQLNKNIKLSYEPILLGTAGTIRNNIQHLRDDDLLVIHADNYCEDSLEGLIVAHNSRPENCIMTMLTFDTLNPKDCGIVVLDSKNIVSEFFEKNSEGQHGFLANGAIYIFSKKLLNEISSEYCLARDISKDLLGLLVGKIYSYKTTQILIDIGTKDGYQKANIWLQKNKI